MDKRHLVYTEQGFETNLNRYQPFTPYRHLDVDGGYHMVHGEVHTPKDFAKDFKFWWDKVIADFVTMGLIVNGKSVSFNKFKKMLDVHTFKVMYGRGKEYQGFISIDEDNRYQFRTALRYNNKEKALSELYMNFTNVVDGRTDELDEQLINFGNRGIPVSGGVMKYRWYDKQATDDFVDELFADVKKND